MNDLNNNDVSVSNDGVIYISGNAMNGSIYVSGVDPVIQDTNKVYLFTASGTSDKSPSLAESKAKANGNILGLKKTRIEILDLTNKEIVNEKPDFLYNEVTHGSYRMNYISCSGRLDEDDFLSSAVGILELSRNNGPGKIGICFFATSTIDDFDGIRSYITDSLIELYDEAFSCDYTIVNFHTAIEGIDLTKEFGTVVAAIVD